MQKLQDSDNELLAKILSCGEQDKRSPQEAAESITIVPVQAENLAAAGQAADLAKSALSKQSDLFDVIEWRVDEFFAHQGLPARLMEGRDLADQTQELLQNMYTTISEVGVPVLTTLRTARDGGALRVNDEEYEQIVEELLLLEPAAIDIEMRAAAAGRLIAACRMRDTVAIASYHDWRATPSFGKLETLFKRGAALGADVTKIAVMPGSREDVLRLLDATAAAAAGGSPVIGIAMGELGVQSRVESSKYGSVATFASLTAASAPGQLDVHELALRKTDCSK